MKFKPFSELCRVKKIEHGKYILYLHELVSGCYERKIGFHAKDLSSYAVPNKASLAVSVTCLYKHQNVKFPNIRVVTTRYIS